MPVAEFVMNANKLPRVKLERTNDRIGIIPFGSWGKISIKEKNKREMEVKINYLVSTLVKILFFQFEKLMSDKRRPFEVLIGTIGKYLHSQVWCCFNAIIGNRNGAGYLQQIMKNTIWDGARSSSEIILLNQ